MNIDNLLIVGNGFDLNLGLKTQYKDFIGDDYCSSKEFNKYAKSNYELANGIKRYSKGELWSGIENDLAEISLEVHKIREEERDYGRKHAFDNPSDIQSFSSLLTGREYDLLNLSRHNRFLDQYVNLKAALCSYLCSICNNSRLNELSEAYKLVIGLINQSENTYIVDFNYTSSIASIMNEFYIKRYRHDASEFLTEKLIKIHGGHEDKNIVFGVQDDVLINPSHTFLRKGVSPHLWDKMLVSDLMSMTRKEIHIFGHSLGASDHTQFRDYFTDFSGNKKDRAKLSIYHHGTPCFYSLFKEIDALTGNQLTRFKASHDLSMVNIKND